MILSTFANGSLESQFSQNILTLMNVVKLATQKL